MKNTMLSELAGRLEGYGDTPAWEISSAIKCGDIEYALKVERTGSIERKSELEDIVKKVSGYDEEYSVMSATTDSKGVWDISVIKNLKETEEVA